MNKSYLVKREHIGDKDYKPGDTREAHPTDVAHLVAAGTLVEVTKAADAPTPAPKPKENTAAPKPRAPRDYKKKVDPPPSTKGEAGEQASGTLPLADPAAGIVMESTSVTPAAATALATLFNALPEGETGRPLDEGKQPAATAENADEGEPDEDDVGDGYGIMGTDDEEE